MTLPFMHMTLFGGSTQAFCGVKTDRYTKARCEPQHVTCRACLQKALYFFAKSSEVARRQFVLTFACPTCEAEPGRACASMAKRWQATRCRTLGILGNGWRKTPHHERVMLAKESA